MNTNIDYDWPTATFHCRSLPGDLPAAVADRQNRVPGFNRAKVAQATILQIGAGGFGGWIATALTREGIGELHICDHDSIEASNLSRQFFYAEDLFTSKALCLAKHAAREGHLGGSCVGHTTPFTAATADRLSANVDLVICCVDNNATRAVASHFFRQVGTPVIFSACNADANYAWAFVQEPAGACLGCVFPSLATADATTQACAPVPAAIHIVRVAAGLCTYAVDSLLGECDRHWNFRSVHLAGGSPDVVTMMPPRAGCKLCGSISQRERI